MIDFISWVIAIALNASTNTDINQTSIAFKEWGRTVNDILVFGSVGSMILIVIMFIEKIDKDKLFLRPIVLVGERGKCCNPRTVKIFPDHYQCKKCERVFYKK